MNSSNDTIVENSANDEVGIGEWIGTFLAILIGAMIGIFIIIGSCVLWSKLYGKFIKKEPKDEIIDPDKPKVVLDLSHELDEEENADDFEKDPKRKSNEANVVAEVDKMPPEYEDKSKTNPAFEN